MPNDKQRDKAKEASDRAERLASLLTGNAGKAARSIANRDKKMEAILNKASIGK